MNLLFYEWGSYIYADLADIFNKEGIRFHTFQYYLKNKSEDEVFEKKFCTEIENGNYDAVFSVNYFPLVAKCCYQKNIIYLSWSYDNPLNVLHMEETLGYPTNRVFLFDKMQAKKYQDMGFQHIYHLPLAVNTSRLDQLSATAVQKAKYGADVSFVGNLYPSALNLYTSEMNEYQKGYIDGICNVQAKIYGYYMIDDMLTDHFMESIQMLYQKVKPGNEFVLPREALSFAMAATVTRKERLTILGLISNHHEVKLYSKEKPELLKNVKHMGTCDYFTEMPLIFKESKINLNMTLKILKAGIPLRALDILGSGGFLLSNYQEELAEHFVPDEEVVLYDSIEDAYAKADFYLRNDSLRLQIARNGYEKAKKEFTYENRLQSIFNTLSNNVLKY